jgi:membrane-associated phospholipid phosphatase
MPRMIDFRPRKGNTHHRAAGRRWWLIIAAAFALAIAFGFDATIDAAVAANRIRPIELAARFVSRFLAWQWLMGAAVIALFVASRMRRRDWQRVLCTMIVAASVAGLSADLLRGLSGRTRPYSRTPQGFYGPRENSQWLIGRHEFNSFPSGHTATITAFVLPLIAWRRRLATVMVPVITIVAGARVYIGAHHLSDVIAGAALGAVVALLVCRRFLVSMTAVPKDTETAWTKP